jgi:hypothetical protein
LPQDFDVDDFALTSAERVLLSALNHRGVRYLVIGLSAAVLQGAPVSTQDLELWIDRPGDDAVKQSAADAGGFWIPAFGMQPPGIGGHGLERIDVVLTAHGLADFESEYVQSLQCLIDDVPVRVLPLDRIIASKRSTNRPKDHAALPALEATIRARADSGRENSA